MTDVDAATLDSAESIIIDGANGVTHAPRHHFPDMGVSWVLLGITIIATLSTKRRGRWLLPVLLFAASVPGLMHVLVLRADAPLRRGALARQVEGTLTEIERVAKWPKPVHVARDDDDVLFPLGRYAVPTRTQAGPGVQELELRGTVLSAQCRGEQPAVCGEAR